MTPTTDPNGIITTEQLEAITAMNKAQSWIVVAAIPNTEDPRHPVTQIFYSDSIAIAGLLDAASIHLDIIQAATQGFFDDHNPLYDDGEETPP